MYSIKDKRTPVLQLQQALLVLGYGESHLVPMDGIYGDNTRLAVMNYQQKNNLSLTGIVDYDTHSLLWEEYQRALCRERMNKFPLSEGTKNEYVQILHACLNILFSRGMATEEKLSGDLFDERTGEYVSRYFSRIGRKYEGHINEAVFQHLLREALMFGESGIVP